MVKILIATMLYAFVQALATAVGLPDRIIDRACPFPEVAVQLFPQYNYAGKPLDIKLDTTCGPDAVMQVSNIKSLPDWNPNNDGEIASVKVSPGCSIIIYNSDNFGSKKYRNSVTGKQDYLLISPYKIDVNTAKVSAINSQVYGIARRRDVYFGGKSAEIVCYAIPRKS
jgi:hypothetical protein